MQSHPASVLNSFTVPEGGISNLDVALVGGNSPTHLK